MPDDLQIPVSTSSQSMVSRSMGRPSYRVDRPPSGLQDPAMRRLLAYAGIALAVLLVGAGGWTMLARRSAGVPVIEADSRPLRVKPDNPGGMQVAGADEPDDTTATLAPAPEAPAPLALRAQVQANRPPAGAAPPAAPAPGAPDPAEPAPRDAQVASNLRNAAPPAQTTPAARPAPSAASAAVGSAQVQLAAVDTEDAARAEWARLQKKLPELLNGRQPLFQRAVDKDGKTVWRVRTAGFADMADATGFCLKVRAKNAGCSLGTF